LKGIVNNVAGHCRWLFVQNPVPVLCLQSLTGFLYWKGFANGKLAGLF